MADKGIKSKRRWAQWLGFIGAVVSAAAPVVATTCPQYAVPATIAAAALSGGAGYLAKKSKDNEADNATL